MFDTRIHYIVVPAGDILPTALRERVSWHSGGEHDCPTVYEAHAATDEESHFAVSALRSADYARVFEQCWLPTTCQPEAHAALVQTLFTTIAKKYDGLITTKNNCRCYEHLYTMAKHKKQTRRSRTLDFGCGTGVITQTGFIGELEELKGFDFCPEMASLARAKGIDVIAQPLNDNIQSNRFDIILAAYVLHFGLASRELLGLLDLLDEGGVLVANFHKGIQLRHAAGYLKHALTNAYSYDVAPSPFGPVLMVLRASSTRR